MLQNTRSESQIREARLANARLLDEVEVRFEDIEARLNAVEAGLAHFKLQLGLVDVAKTRTWSDLVAVWASRLLREADRDRYLGEYRAELYDLASSGATGAALIGYACRVLLRAPLLSWELRKLQRERGR